MPRQDDDEIRMLAQKLLADYGNHREIDTQEFFHRPDKESVREITKKLLRLITPGFYRDRNYRFYNMEGNIMVLIEDVLYNLSQQIGIVLRYANDRHIRENAADCGCSEGDMDEQAYCLAKSFLFRIPNIREYVQTDLEATFQGDPAAYNMDEIILSYPGLLATTINRLAHELFLLNIPLIPRIMTEYAHSTTGIDIHPGATIGKYFFIDHGTGIVIGSTTHIGDHVKVYQGVTLGALSTSGGQSLHGVKRHPTIEDNVTIYSGASILGGNTVIGKNSVIGSNAFLTKSVPEGTRVTIRNQELQFATQSGQIMDMGDIGQSDEWYYMI